MEETAIDEDDPLCHRRDGKTWQCKYPKLKGENYCKIHFERFKWRKRGRTWESKNNPPLGIRQSKKSKNKTPTPTPTPTPANVEPPESDKSEIADADKKSNQVVLDRVEGSPSQEKELTDHVKEKPSTIELAKKLEAKLGPALPSFVKSLRPQDVNNEFTLWLPAPFCHANLPKEDVMINLIDEKKEKYPVNYLGIKFALTLGWKEFSVAHELADGDALVFQLLKPAEFQVYIVKAHNMAETDGINIDGLQKQIESCNGVKVSEETMESHRKAHPFNALEQPDGRKSRSGSDEIGSKVLEGIKILRTPVKFKDMKSLKSFTIVVNGLIIDSEFSEQALSIYYELCCSQKAFLHDSLRETINCKLAAGLISQTIDIAYDIRASKLTTSLTKFTEWDKNLGAFEKLGMKVAFLRDRIKKLVNLVIESQELDSKKYREALAGRDIVKEEIRTLEVKLGDLREASKRSDMEIKTLKEKFQLHESMFRAEVEAPWS